MKITFIILAILFGLLAIAPLLFPSIIVLLPEAYKSKEYFDFVASVSVTLGSISGVLFIYVAFLQQQKEFREAEKEKDEKRSQIIIDRYIDSYLKTKSRINYRDKESDKAIDDFYDNLKKYVLKEPAKIKDKNLFQQTLIIGINGSAFTKDGHLLIYKKSLERLMNKIIKFEAYDMLEFLEAEMTEKEKCLIIYLWNFYFETSKDFFELSKRNFLTDFEDNVLIEKIHKNWFK